MGYIKNLIDNIEFEIVLLSIGIAITFISVVLIMYFYVNSNKGKWIANTSMDVMVTKQKDSIDKLIANTEKQLQKSKIKINARRFIAITALFSALLFIVTLFHFKNFLASVLIAATFYLIPEYVFFLIQDRINKKVEDQIVIGVRVFTSEYLKNKNMEKSLAETSQRVLDPVGGYFADAYADLLMGYPYETVISKMGNRTDNKYWKIFTQLLHQLRADSTVIHLFTDLITRTERNIEATRNNDSTLSGERTLALIMSLIPIPAYLLMKDIVPETSYFINETPIGRFVLILSFASTLLFLFVDKFSRKV